MPGWLICTSGEPAVWVMAVPDTSGVSLKISAPLAEVG